MKVLLIRIPQGYSEAIFSLGLAYIARTALKSGHDVEVLDIPAHNYTDEKVVQRIKHLDYDVVGISALSMQYAYTKWLASELKKCNPNKIVVGGHLATYSPEIVLRNTEADICVIGEGEITFNEMLANLDNLEDVKGICFKQDDKVIKNPPREYIQNLDSIEFPAWDLFPIDIYIENSRFIRHPNIKCMWVLGSRGCPYNCRYCSKEFFKVRFRSVDNIVAEIKELTGKYPQVKGILFGDELLGLNKKWMYELCDKVEPLNMIWRCDTRVNLVDFELLKRMKKAGCAVVEYGIESGSQTILDNMNKKVSVEQAENAVRETIKAGISPRIFMMYGYPGETKETLKETIDFFKRLPYLSFYTITMVRPFSLTTPLPGSELYNQVLKEGLIENEDKYLENLIPHTVPDSAWRDDMTVLPRLNLTKFGEKEFYQLKRKTENEIVWGNMRRHPLPFARDYLPYLLRRVAAGVTGVVPYLRRHGLKQTIQGFIRIVMIRR